MRGIWLIIILLIFVACKDGKDQKVYNKPNEALDFLKSRKYAFSTEKSAIPLIVIDSIGSVNHAPFRIGDSSDVGNINLSDLWMRGSAEYSRKLNFVLVGDTSCLISYVEGGSGTHDVIDYIQYKGTFRHMRYKLGPVLNDTIELREFLEGAPDYILPGLEEPVKDSSMVAIPVRDSSTIELESILSTDTADTF